MKNCPHQKHTPCLQCHWETIERKVDKILEYLKIDASAEPDVVSGCISEEASIWAQACTVCRGEGRVVDSTTLVPSIINCRTCGSTGRKLVNTKCARCNTTKDCCYIRIADDLSVL